MTTGLWLETRNASVSRSRNSLMICGFQDHHRLRESAVRCSLSCSAVVMGRHNIASPSPAEGGGDGEIAQLIHDKAGGGLLAGAPHRYTAPPMPPAHLHVQPPSFEAALRRR